MALRIRQAVQSLPISPTLGANQKANERRAQGEPVFHMGFGQSPFPAPKRLRQAVAATAHANHYEHVAGLDLLREKAGTYLSQDLGVNREDFDVLIAPGSKLILYALQQALEGDVMIPVPSWVSYAPQAQLLGDVPIFFDAELSDDGYVIQPETLNRAVLRAKAEGLNPTKLILNSPNNPTGLTIPHRTHAGLAQVCAEQGLFVISDEIYRLVSFSIPDTSFAASLPAQTAVTTGLSKHLSLGGWRIGVGLIPRAVPGLSQAMEAIASETWSAVATPMQLGSLEAFAGEPQLERYIQRCTRIHHAVATSAANILRSAGLCCPYPQGAFYLWPEFDAFRQPLTKLGVQTSKHLADYLLEHHHTLTLPGEGFGVRPDRLGLRLSVCDYDGASALEVAHEDAGNVEQYAPNVLAGVRAIANLINSLR